MVGVASSQVTSLELVDRSLLRFARGAAFRFRPPFVIF